MEQDNGRGGRQDWGDHEWDEWAAGVPDGGRAETMGGGDVDGGEGGRLLSSMCSALNKAAERNQENLERVHAFHTELFDQKIEILNQHIVFKEV